MTPNTELIPCPGGCGNQVHPRATDCPYCGYRPEGARFEDLLGSLGLISSILVGFGMEALITLISSKPDTSKFDTPTEETLDPIMLKWTYAVWIVSAVLLLVAMVLAEAIRRRESGVSDIRVSPQQVADTRRRCARLVFIFTAGLLTTTAG